MDAHPPPPFVRECEINMNRQLGILFVLAGVVPLRAQQTGLRSTIAFVSTRHEAAADPTVDPQRTWLAAEIYLMDGDGSNPRRVTENAAFDCFPALSPDGTRIAFHASASGAGRPINALPGAATTDGDIFVLNVADFLARRTPPRNLTNNPAAIDDDPDWSPDGRTIVYTSHAVTDNGDDHRSAEIYVTAADGTGRPTRLTSNDEEERAPAWSPDGTRLVFMCRRGGTDFEICVMNADGTGQVQLTDNTIGD